MGIVTAESASRAIRSKGRRLVARHDRLYRRLESLARSFLGREEPEFVAKLVEQAATYATHFHPGRLSSPELDSIALELGRDLPAVSEAAIREISGDDAFELHVVSSVSAFGGGHARLLRDWLRNAPVGVARAVVLTRQQGAVPSWFADAAQALGTRVLTLAGETGLVDKAAALRAIAARAGVIVCHVHPDDVVPVIAFARAGGPPVVYMNHADHLFWIGSSVADLCVDFRDGRERAPRRGLRATGVLPLPTTPPPTPPARDGSPPENGRVILVTVAAAYKLRPTARQNLLATLGEVLRRNPEAELWVIGTAEAWEASGLSSGVLDRIKFLGQVDDSDEVVAQADIFLESFPYGSWNAVLDACTLGVAPVLKPAPEADYLVIREPWFGDRLTHAPDEAAYVAQVEKLIREPEERMSLARWARENVGREHSGPAWQRRLADLLGRAVAGRHSPSVGWREACGRSEEDCVKAYFADLHWHGDRTMRRYLGGELVRRAAHWMRRGSFSFAVRYGVAAVGVSFAAVAAYASEVVRARSARLRSGPGITTGRA